MRLKFTVAKGKILMEVWRKGNIAHYTASVLYHQSPEIMRVLASTVEGWIFGNKREDTLMKGKP